MENRTYDSGSCRERPHPHFGMFLPFLIIPLAISMMRHMGRKMAWQMREGQGPENWRRHGVPPIFAELHRRAHEAEAAAATAPATPAAPPAEA
jgi:hypothetical protein